jgi:hypothetical protein
MGVIPGSVRVTGFIAPTDDTDTYPSHEDIWGKGGYREVADAAGRLAITAGRRSIGMLVKQLDTGVFWTLNGGIADINWAVQSFGGATDTETIRFVGNGIFPIDDRVDGGWIAPANCTISGVWADIGERGKNDGGVTDNIWDVHLNGVTIFTVQANRPTIATSVGGGEASVASGVIAVTAVLAGDRLTIDTDQVGNGSIKPANFAIIILVVY